MEEVLMEINELNKKSTGKNPWIFIMLNPQNH